MGARLCGAALTDDEADFQKLVYIRRACPGGEEPHVISIPAGHPRPGDVWPFGPEHELELNITVQCTGCMRVFLIARENAEALESTDAGC